MQTDGKELLQRSLSGVFAANTRDMNERMWDKREKELTRKRAHSESSGDEDEIQLLKRNEQIRKFHELKRLANKKTKRNFDDDVWNHDGWDMLHGDGKPRPKTFIDRLEEESDSDSEAYSKRKKKRRKKSKKKKKKSKKKKSKKKKKKKKRHQQLRSESSESSVDDRFGGRIFSRSREKSSASSQDSFGRPRRSKSSDRSRSPSSTVNAETLNIVNTSIETVIRKSSRSFSGQRLSDSSEESKSPGSNHMQSRSRETERLIRKDGGNVGVKSKSDEGWTSVEAIDLVPDKNKKIKKESREETLSASLKAKQQLLEQDLAALANIQEEAPPPTFPAKPKFQGIKLNKPKIKTMPLKRSIMELTKNSKKTRRRKDVDFVFSHTRPPIESIGIKKEKERPKPVVHNLNLSFKPKADPIQNRVHNLNMLKPPAAEVPKPQPIANNPNPYAGNSNLSNSAVCPPGIPISAPGFPNNSSHNHISNISVTIPRSAPPNVLNLPNNPHIKSTFHHSLATNRPSRQHNISHNQPINSHRNISNLGNSSVNSHMIANPPGIPLAPPGIPPNSTMATNLPNISHGPPGIPQNPPGIPNALNINMHTVSNPHNPVPRNSLSLSPVNAPIVVVNSSNLPTKNPLKPLNNNPYGLSANLQNHSGVPINPHNPIKGNPTGNLHNNPKTNLHINPNSKPHNPIGAPHKNPTGNLHNKPTGNPHNSIAGNPRNNTTHNNLTGNPQNNPVGNAHNNATGNPHNNPSGNPHKHNMMPMNHNIQQRQNNPHNRMNIRNNLMPANNFGMRQQPPPQLQQRPPPHHQRQPPQFQRNRAVPQQRIAQLQQQMMPPPKQQMQQQQQRQGNPPMSSLSQQRQGNPPMSPPLQQRQGKNSVSPPQQRQGNQPVSSTQQRQGNQSMPQRQQRQGNQSMPKPQQRQGNQSMPQPPQRQGNQSMQQPPQRQGNQSIPPPVQQRQTGKPQPPQQSTQQKLSPGQQQIPPQHQQRQLPAQQMQNQQRAPVQQRGPHFQQQQQQPPQKHPAFQIPPSRLPMNFQNNPNGFRGNMSMNFRPVNQQRQNFMPMSPHFQINQNLRMLSSKNFRQVNGSNFRPTSPASPALTKRPVTPMTKLTEQKNVQFISTPGTNPNTNSPSENKSNSPKISPNSHRQQTRSPGLNSMNQQTLPKTNTMMPMTGISNSVLSQPPNPLLNEKLNSSNKISRSGIKNISRPSSPAFITSQSPRPPRPSQNFIQRNQPNNFMPTDPQNVPLMNPNATRNMNPNSLGPSPQIPVNTSNRNNVLSIPNLMIPPSQNQNPSIPTNATSPIISNVQPMIQHQKLPITSVSTQNPQQQQKLITFPVSQNTSISPTPAQTPPNRTILRVPSGPLKSHFHTLLGGLSNNMNSFISPFRPMVGGVGVPVVQNVMPANVYHVGQLQAARMRPPTHQTNKDSSEADQKTPEQDPPPQAPVPKIVRASSKPRPSSKLFKVVKKTYKNPVRKFDTKQSEKLKRRLERLKDSRSRDRNDSRDSSYSSRSYSTSRDKSLTPGSKHTRDIHKELLRERGASDESRSRSRSYRKKRSRRRRRSRSKSDESASRSRSRDSSRSSRSSRSESRSKITKKHSRSSRSESRSKITKKHSRSSRSKSRSYSRSD